MVFIDLIDCLQGLHVCEGCTMIWKRVMQLEWKVLRRDKSVLLTLLVFGIQTLTTNQACRVRAWFGSPSMSAGSRPIATCRSMSTQSSRFGVRSTAVARTSHIIVQPSVCMTQESFVSSVPSNRPDEYRPVRLQCKRRDSPQTLVQ